MTTMRKLLSAALLLSTLAGCEQAQQAMGLEDPTAKAAKQDAEGKAVGGGCRHSGRAIEDCYSIYSWLPKAAIFAGWQDMDAYMRTNKLDTVEPQLPPPQPPGKKKKEKAPEEEAAKGDAAKGEAPKGEGKAAAKASH